MQNISRKSRWWWHQLWPLPMLASYRLLSTQRGWIWLSNYFHCKSCIDELKGKAGEDTIISQLCAKVDNLTQTVNIMMEMMRKSKFHAEAKSAFYGELFLEQCREYASFKAFNKVMPRFNIPLETQAMGEPKCHQMVILSLMVALTIIGLLQTQAPSGWSITTNAPHSHPGSWKEFRHGFPSLVAISTIISWPQILVP